MKFNNERKSMKVYHITISPQARIAYLYFWGCNLKCRACMLKKEVYDCHLPDTKDNIFNSAIKSRNAPERFLDLSEVMQKLNWLEIKEVIFIGAEATTDPELPELAETLHKEFNSHNILLTNGFIFTDLRDIDEVVFSIKAYSNELHRHYTGRANSRALNNFARYYYSRVRLRTESVFIPGYIDLPEIEKLSNFIARFDCEIPYRIDAYVPVGDNLWRRPTSIEMKQAVKVANKYLNNVTCLTGNELLKFEVKRLF